MTSHMFPDKNLKEIRTFHALECTSTFFCVAGEFLESYDLIFSFMFTFISKSLNF